ncbi:MAG: hypothetical protein RR198_03845 [Oscillospiraceae bacterium]
MILKDVFVFELFYSKVWRSVTKIRGLCNVLTVFKVIEVFDMLNVLKMLDVFNGLNDLNILKALSAPQIYCKQNTRA